MAAASKPSTNGSKKPLDSLDPIPATYGGPGVDGTAAPRKGAADIPHPHYARGDTGEGRERFFFDVPVVDCDLVEDTPLKDAMDVIAAQYPAHASVLRHHYNKKVVHQGAIYSRAVTEEFDALEKANLLAEESNGLGESRVAELFKMRGEAGAPVQSLIESFDDPLDKARQSASEACAKAGGCFDPAKPSDACVLIHSRQALELIADDLKLPWPYQKTFISKPLWIFLSAVVGTILATSIVLAAGIINADQIIKRLPFILVAAVIGYGLAVGGKWAVRYAWTRVGQYRYRGPVRDYLMAMVVALIVLFAVLITDVVVERAGLLARVQVEAELGDLSGAGMSSSTPGGWVYFAIGLIVTIGYLISAAGDAYREGRCEQVGSQLVAEQERRFRADEAKLRSAPAVQDALARLAEVQRIEYRIGELKERMAERRAPFDAEIARIEAHRRPIADQLSPEAYHRIHAARRNHLGAQSIYDNEVLPVLNAVEPIKGTFGVRRSAWSLLR
jgi:hypothetical protein